MATSRIVTGSTTRSVLAQDRSGGSLVIPEGTLVSVPVSGAPDPDEVLLLVDGEERLVRRSDFEARVRVG